MNSKLPSSRRKFLFKTIAILPVTSALAACEMQAGAAMADAPPYQPVFFKPGEWQTLQAAIDRLIPADAEGPGALDLDVAVFIDKQLDGSFGHASTWYMQGPFHPDAPSLSGYQSPMTPRDLYRTGIAALNAHCKAHFDGKTFAGLGYPQQDALLHGLDAGSVKFDNTSAPQFIAMLWQNTKEGYFSDPVHGGNKNAGSWKMIGFPGARADYIDWVVQPGKPYPLGPVTIAGKQV